MARRISPRKAKTRPKKTIEWKTPPQGRTDTRVVDKKDIRVEWKASNPRVGHPALVEKGPITWVKPKAQLPSKILPRWCKSPFLGEELEDLFAKHLIPGALFTFLVDIETRGEELGRTPPFVYQHLRRSWDPKYDVKRETIAQVGGFAIYCGCRLEDEQSWDGKIFRESRYIFLIGGGQYIVPDLRFVRPVL